VFRKTYVDKLEHIRTRKFVNFTGHLEAFTLVGGWIGLTCMQHMEHIKNLARKDHEKGRFELLRRRWEVYGNGSALGPKAHLGNTVVSHPVYTIADYVIL
jgi:hypothetical protein